MSTDISLQGANGPTKITLADAVERVLVGGDLNKLTTEQRLDYYLSRCAAANLDPRSRPFEYIQLNGKLVLYANKSCTDQLSGLHGLSHQIISRGMTADGLYEAVVRVTWPSGRYTEDTGVVVAGALKGEALANAMMRAVTKAKRRAVLSTCGLGDILDESELDTCRDVRPVDQPRQIVDNGTGYGSGKYAPPEQVESYLAAMEGYLNRRNQAWLDKWTNHGGEILEGVKDLCNRWHADNHLIKWAMETGALPAGLVPETGLKNSQIGRLTAIVYHRSKTDQRALTKELARYLDDQERVATQALARKHPELFDADGEDDGDYIEVDANGAVVAQEVTP